jgi:hypothetical protein
MLAAQSEAAAAAVERALAAEKTVARPNRWGLDKPEAAGAVDTAAPALAAAAPDAAVQIGEGEQRAAKLSVAVYKEARDAIQAKLEEELKKHRTLQAEAATVFTEDPARRASLVAGGAGKGAGDKAYPQTKAGAPASPGSPLQHIVLLNPLSDFAAASASGGQQESAAERAVARRDAARRKSVLDAAELSLKRIAASLSALGHTQHFHLRSRNASVQVSEAAFEVSRAAGAAAPRKKWQRSFAASPSSGTGATAAAAAAAAATTTTSTSTSTGGAGNNDSDSTPSAGPGATGSSGERRGSIAGATSDWSLRRDTKRKKVNPHLPEEFRVLLRAIAPAYKPRKMPQRTMQRLVSQIYAEDRETRIKNPYSSGGGAGGAGSRGGGGDSDPVDQPSDAAAPPALSRLRRPPLVSNLTSASLGSLAFGASSSKLPLSSKSPAAAPSDDFKRVVYDCFCAKYGMAQLAEQRLLDLLTSVRSPPPGCLWADRFRRFLRLPLVAGTAQHESAGEGGSQLAPPIIAASPAAAEAELTPINSLLLRSATHLSGMSAFGGGGGSVSGSADGAASLPPEQSPLAQAEELLFYEGSYHDLCFQNGDSSVAIEEKETGRELLTLVHVDEGLRLALGHLVAPLVLANLRSEVRRVVVQVALTDKQHVIPKAVVAVTVARRSGPTGTVELVPVDALLERALASWRAARATVHRRLRALFVAADCAREGILSVARFTAAARAAAPGLSRAGVTRAYQASLQVGDNSEVCQLAQFVHAGFRHGLLAPATWQAEAPQGLAQLAADDGMLGACADASDGDLERSGPQLEKRWSTAHRAAIDRALDGLTANAITQPQQKELAEHRKRVAHAEALVASTGLEPPGETADARKVRVEAAWLAVWLARYELDKTEREKLVTSTLGSIQFLMRWKLKMRRLMGWGDAQAQAQAQAQAATDGDGPASSADAAAVAAADGAQNQQGQGHRLWPGQELEQSQGLAQAKSAGGRLKRARVKNPPIFSRCRWHRTEDFMRLLDGDDSVPAEERAPFPVDGVDECGNSLLHVAVQNGHDDYVQVLLDRGINVDLQNCTGQTAMHFAKGYGHKRIFFMLRRAGANDMLRNNNGVLCHEMENTG